MTVSRDSNTTGYTKVWSTVITNTQYLSGLLALDYSLKKVGSKYPLVALFTENLDEEGHKALDLRGILKLQIHLLSPSTHRDYSNDPRFYDCWTKLQPFNLTQFERIVQLDSDMIVLHNMDELFDIELNKEDKIFAASHACVCNPYKKPHYPKDWVKENCAYTYYETDAEGIYGPPCNTGLAMCNGGLQVVKPDATLYDRIQEALNDPSKIDSYDFADQSLLSDVFKDEWVPLSYKYNALKTLRTVHAPIWNDAEVKNIHYILGPKPWNIEKASRSKFKDDTETFAKWYAINDERLEKEAEAGIYDGF